MPTQTSRTLPWLWIAVLAIASVALSVRLSCATPFAALATLAALNMRRADGLAMILAAFGLNQLVGYATLGYPHEWDSYAWGGAIGVAAVATFFAASALAPRLARFGQITMMAATLAAAFAVYEIVLFAATAVLPSSEQAFALDIVAQIALVNALVFPALLLAVCGAELAGLPGLRARA
jgi:hypothetical protein